MINLIPRLEFLFQSFFREQKNCPHCQSDQVITVGKKYGRIRIKECKECYLFFTSPLYKTYLAPNFYDHLYQGSGSVTKMPGFKELNNLRENAFVSSDRNFSSQIEALASLCPNGNKKLLEMGSSWGYFLYQARQRGFDVTGIEIADRRRLFGIRHLNVPIIRDFSELDAERFDVIYASHVLEHLLDPSHAFKNFYQHLKPKGRLVIEVPNFDYHRLGNRVKKIIGAVHPLGFSSQFFIFNLPKYHFKLLGLFNDWTKIIARSSSICPGEQIIVLAEKG